MRKFNEMYVIGIDHGYGNMKTANCCFPTGVMKSDTEPTFVSDLLQWNGKYYSIGVGHKEFTADKFTTRTIMYSPLPLSHGSYGENASPRLLYLSPQDYP